MTYQLKEHTADIAVEATGEDLDTVFAAIADGLAAACLDPNKVPGGGDRFDIAVSADALDSLLYDYLDELIFQRDVQNVLPVDNEATVQSEGDEWQLTGSARGVPAAGLGGREVKAVTYSDMVIEERNGEWYAYVVFDM